MTGCSRPGIVVVERSIDPAELRRLVDLYFGDMVKIVVDVGSVQADLWGANYYPGRGPDGCLEYTALIGRGEELPR